MLTPAPQCPAMARKRSTLVLRSDADRDGQRERVALSGTCRIGGRPVQEVHVVDLSPSGCQLIGRAVGVTKGETMELTMASLGPFAGTLKWAKRGALGVAFDTPLDEQALARLGEAEAAHTATVVPIRRRSQS
jgi:hypothetical protein